MGKSSSSLAIEHYSVKIEKAKEFIKGRMEGKFKSLKTSLKKFNAATFDGLEWNRIITIAGLSGVGKSIGSSQLKRDLVDCNPDEKFDILAFEMEMSGIDQVTRDISSKVEMSTKKIYSAGEKLSQAEYDLISETGDKMKYYPIYVIDEVGTVDQIIETILKYVEENKLKAAGKGIICTIDHTLLIRGIARENDQKAVVDDLYIALVALKKHFETMEVNCMFIVLNQLNREIEKGERVSNPMMQYPNRTDIFGSSAPYFCSDYVVIMHKPAIIESIGKFYGPPRDGHIYGLPVFNPLNPNQAMIYWHVLKARFAEPCIIALLDDFKNSRILEFTDQLT